MVNNIAFYIKEGLSSGVTLPETKDIVNIT